MLRKKSVCAGILIGLLLICGCSKLRLADAKMGEENYNEAIGLYKKHLAEHPDSVQIRIRLGYAYFKTGRFDEAISEFKNVLVSLPGEPDAVLYTGLAYLHKGELDKGIALLATYKNNEYPKAEEEVLYQVYMLKDTRNRQAVQSSEVANQIETAVNQIVSAQKSEKQKQPWKKKCSCGS